MAEIMYLLWENGMTSLQEASQVIRVGINETMPVVLAHGNMSDVLNYIRMGAGL